MLNFVQNIQYYMMFEVMEPTWHILEKNLKLVSEDGMEVLTNVIQGKKHLIPVAAGVC